MRSLRELWKISYPLYIDTFLGEFAHRRVKNLERFLKGIRRQAIINKLIISALLVTTGVYSASLSAIDVSAFYLMTLFVVTFFFLHTMTTFVSKGFEILYTLPLSEEEIAKVRLFAFLRIFDVPLFLLTLSFPIAMAVFHGVLSFFPSLVCIISVETLSLWLSLKFAKFFYERISYSTSSPLATVLRIVTYLAWSVAVFGAYGISSMLSVLSKLKGYERLVYEFSFLFPFNYAIISMGVPDPTALATSVPFVILSVFAARRCVDLVRCEARIRIPTSEKFEIKKTGVVMAFLKKDVKMITRNPGLMLIVFLPVGEGLLLGAISMNPTISLMIVLGYLPIVTFVSMGIERRDLLATLPVRRRDVILSKTLLGCQIYLISTFLLMLKSSIPILLFPSVFAMFVISSTMAESLEATKNIYASIGPVLLVIGLSYLVAYIPLMFGFVAKFLGRSVVLSILIPALVEMGVAIVILSTL